MREEKNEGRSMVSFAPTRSNAKNDGKAFENLIKMANRQYENLGIASIDKTPNPWQVVRRGKKIVSAFPVPEEKLVDFEGTLTNGRAVFFEAKSTLIETRFPLNNISEHQYKFLKNKRRFGAITFVLIEFVKHKEIYFLPFEDLEYWWEKSERKSIPYSWFKEQGKEVKPGRRVIMDYLHFVDQ